MADTCTHLDAVDEVTPSSQGCEHLRVRMSCGHVGCCDSSKRRHATAQQQASAHPLIQSYEPGEDWWWCYVDEVAFAVDGPSYAHP